MAKTFLTAASGSSTSSNPLTPAQTPGTWTAAAIATLPSGFTEPDDHPKAGTLPNVGDVRNPGT